MPSPNFHAALLAVVTSAHVVPEKIRAALQLLNDRATRATSAWIARSPEAGLKDAAFLLSPKREWLERGGESEAKWTRRLRKTSGWRDVRAKFRLEAGKSGWYVFADGLIPLDSRARNTFAGCFAHVLREYDRHLLEEESLERTQASQRTRRKFWQDLTDVDKPALGLTGFNQLFRRMADGLASEFPGTIECVVGHSLRAWRSQRISRPKPLATVRWYGKGPKQAVRRSIAYAFHAAVAAAGTGGLRCENKPRELRLAESHPLARLFGGPLRVFTLALYRPRRPKAPDAFPFLAVVTRDSGDGYLPSRECDTICEALFEFRALLRATDIAQRAEAEEDLGRQIQAKRQPEEAAQALVNFVADQYAATEVALLERQGNFLNVLSAQNVDRDDVPPIYVPSGRGLVTVVAQTNVARYDPDVTQLNPSLYLPVVADTRTQYTLPLTWRATNLGVMLVGLGVHDALWEHDRDSIGALAVRCAESIAALRDDMELHKMLHALKDNLPIVREQIGIAVTSREDPAEVLESAKALVTHCLDFVVDYARTESTDTPQSKSLGSLVRLTLEEAPLKIWLEQQNVPVVFNQQDDLRVYANEEALGVAIRQVIMNGVDAVLEERRTRSASSQRDANYGGVRIRLRRDTRQFNALKQRISFGVIEIADDGVDIPRELQSRIFDFGYSTKGNSHFGGGLNIAKRAMERFGGRLELTTDARGKRFQLFVPTEVK
jgi:signal transduction histidine kinase